MTVGERISQLRKENNISQTQLAILMNVSRQAVSKWENDVSCPDIALLPKLSKILGVTTDELLTGSTAKVSMMPEAQRKSLDELIMRIRVNSADGDKVKVNLPMSLLKVCMEVGVDIAPNFVDGVDAIRNLDLAKIMYLAEQGVIGKLVEIESAKGDIVEVVIE
jgi:transcriptional regulator with XRE-family HTH domain